MQPLSTTLILDSQVVTPQVNTASGFAYTPTLRLADGVHSVTAQVYDQAGNQAQSGPWSFTVDDDSAPSLGVTKYYYHGTQRVAMRQDDVVYFIHADHPSTSLTCACATGAGRTGLGSTSLTTDITGTVVAETRYLPYGEERWTNGAAVTDFTFTGQRAERGFGLLDYNARYYDPWLGRFISADTVVPEAGSPQALNRYSYVLNRPLQGGDPTGHQGPVEEEPPWWAYVLAEPFSPEEENPLANVPGWTSSEYYQFLLDYYTHNAQEWSNTASDVALGLDATAFVLSGIEMLAADVAGGLFIAGGAAAAGPEGAMAGLELAVLVDIGIASGSPMAVPENFLGVASLGATIASDVFAGYTGPMENGIAVGQDTLIAFRNMGAGFLPESNLDYLISLSQLNYDLERRDGLKESSSIEISREQVGELLHLIFLEHWH